LPPPAPQGLDLVIVVAGHEMTEGMTDPDYGAPAFGSADSDHAIWDMFPGSETNDMCKFNPDAVFKSSSYSLQRYWLNSAAASGKDPCWPHVSAAPYFNSVPDLDDNVTFSSGGPPQVLTKGLKIPIGGSGSTKLHLFSEAATGGPWTITARDHATVYHHPPTLTFSFDTNQGQNGDVVTMTVHVLAADPSFGAEPFVIESKLGDQVNQWFGVVGN
jgi:hypothetical protein